MLYTSTKQRENTQHDANTFRQLHWFVSRITQGIHWYPLPLSDITKVKTGLSTSHNATIFPSGEQGSKKKNERK